ncbi:gamma-glutamyltranspeptidase [Pedobacter sp. PACM 27299]|uniref:gamma-glutamyltransferase n=1 Tax=Pedobacter sp. PACM 27299 TaxID=1727164 RepID=UPI000705FFAC|nr:gamma-glutamyltransferase [Pedobacter sp. PACM 27299]ALL04527.1 gamma-glutamyltranspeptidase [Pedobacter sp. PACM 27299]
MQRIIRARLFLNINGFLLITAVLLSGCAGTQPARKNEKDYRNGMVVSASPFASKVGLDILKKGGNAVDAAVAVQFALAVVYPNAGNIGGGGFMVYRAADGSSNTLDFREKAGAAASRDMYLDQSGAPIVDKSLYGQLAAGVPGSVAGMVTAHEKYGKLPWATLVEPAILLARNGFPLSKQQVGEFNELREKLLQFNPDGTALLKDGKWTEGELLKQEELASTLELIRDQGRAGFYEGKVADLLLKEMNRGGGILTKADLQHYQAIWRRPITGTYKDYRIITMPPPSSGGIALIQLLKSVEPFPLKKWGFQQDSTVQLMVEAERRVYADRATHLGDPDFYDVPANALMKDQYIKDRMKSMDWLKATPSASVKAGAVQGKEHEETTHYSIVDQEGNAVSVTTTLNGSYGATVVVKGAGFLLNNEMDDFSVKPGAANMYGLIGGEANAIAPGKRMLSSMTPTILEKDGKLFMVVGTPGGSTIITSVFQTILNVIEFDHNMQQAVSAKRFHHQWLPDLIYTEKGAIDSITRVKLQAKGYIIAPRGPMGRVDAILKTKQGGYQGAADPRGDDQWLGW